ncbi:MAG: GNAT family N-acetyltransferase [Deltaproteobacteria bacterium]|nr:MAG: GNAT family N-acetyltransferase [Deltaproteobacteria bacterium]
MKIIKATKEHAPGVAILFDLYRQFYECESDIELAEAFISDRIQKGESAIFLADDNGILKGFVQMYPSFCSVDAIKIFILYDLYVDASDRNSGIGALLMNRASGYAREEGASRIDLMTAFDNKPGQHLYEKLGYKRESEDFYSYSLQV